MIGDLITIEATATYPGGVSHTASYCVVSNPMQKDLPRPIRLTRGYDQTAVGLRVWFRYNATWMQGVLIRGGLVLTDDHVVYQPEGW